MNAKLFFLTFALALSVTVQTSPSRAVSTATLPQSCVAFCSKVHCFPEDICGPYIDLSTGQAVCGCHTRP